MKGIIICILVGILLFAWGTGTSNYTKWDENVQVESGGIILENGAYDPTFDVSVPSPVLYRCVEMYRYYEINVEKSDGSREHDWAIGWTESGVTPSGKKNPPWPEDLRSETFYGDVKLSGSGLYLSDEVLDHFGDSYVYIEEDYELLSVGNLSEEMGVKQGFSLEGDNCYTTVSGKEKIGDIRITYLAVDPKVLEKTYTVVGLVKDGVIGVHEGDYIDDDIYDRIILPEEIKKDREDFNLIFSIVARILGAVLILLPAGLLFATRASRKKKERVH